MSCGWQQLDIVSMSKTLIISFLELYFISIKLKSMEQTIIISCAFLNSLLVAKIRVRIGEWDFSSTSEPLSNIERKIAKKIVHPKYNFFTYENDLALLKLDKRIDFQDNIIPICLPANDDLLIGKILILNQI